MGAILHVKTCIFRQKRCQFLRFLANFGTKTIKMTQIRHFFGFYVKMYNFILTI